MDVSNALENQMKKRKKKGAEPRELPKTPRLSYQLPETAFTAG